MVANDVTEPGAGFGTETNIVTLVFPGGRVEKLEKMEKLDVAGRVLDAVVRLKKHREHALSAQSAPAASR